MSNLFSVASFAAAFVVSANSNADENKKPELKTEGEKDKSDVRVFAQKGELTKLQGIKEQFSIEAKASPAGTTLIFKEKANKANVLTFANLEYSSIPVFGTTDTIEFAEGHYNIEQLKLQLGSKEQPLFVQADGITKLYNESKGKVDEAIATAASFAPEFPKAKSDLEAASKALADAKQDSGQGPSDIGAKQDAVKSAQEAYDKSIGEARTRISEGDSSGEQLKKFNAALDTISSEEAKSKSLKKVFDAAEGFKQSTLPGAYDALKGSNDAQLFVQKTVEKDPFAGMEKDFDGLEKMQQLGRPLTAKTHFENLANHAGIDKLKPEEQKAIIDSFSNIRKAINGNKDLSASEKEQLRKEGMNQLMDAFLHPENAPAAPKKGPTPAQKQEAERAEMKKQLEAANQKLADLQSKLDQVTQQANLSAEQAKSANAAKDVAEAKLNAANNDLKNAETIKNQAEEIANLKGQKLSEEKIAELNKKIGEADAARQAAEATAKKSAADATAANEAKAKAEAESTRLKAELDKVKQPPAAEPKKEEAPAENKKPE